MNFRYMQKGAEAVHAVNPNVLVILSELSFNTNLSFLLNRPVNLTFKGKLVFEVHSYGFFDGSAWIIGNPNQVCGQVVDQMMRKGGFLLNQRYPFFMSEFGVDLRGTNDNDNRYLNCILGVAAELDLDWALWTLAGSYYLRAGVIGSEEFFGVYNWNWCEARNSSFLKRISAVQSPFQAEATNKTLIRILSKMMDEFGGTWSEQLIVALWAYRTSKRKPTQAAPYSLVYGSEAVLPIELETPSARMALASGMVLEPRTTRLEALEEKHDRAAKVMERYHESIARAYNQTVIPRKFEEGDLVWKIVDPIMRGQPLPKFSPKWEGPYKVVRASSSGYYKLVRVEDGFRTGPLNAKFIKHYYP
ncbi:unnamed protein product [Camellia sinensis]